MHLLRLGRLVLLFLPVGVLLGPEVEGITE